MLCVDVNVLVYAHRADLDDHSSYRSTLESLANGDEPLGLPDAVLSGYLRLVTNRRIFNEPTPAEKAWRDVDDLVAAPAAMTVRPGTRHGELFRRLADGIGACGNDITDAYLAAYAVENNATWLSADRGFARFPQLRWAHPLDA